jgi:hypothetical protein
VQTEGQALDTKDRHHTFYNDCNEAISEEACRIIKPHAIKAFKSKVEVTGWKDKAYDGHRAYIRCLQDNAVAIQGQDGMIQASGVEWNIKTLDASHSPFLSVPEELAKVVSEINEQFV